MGFHIKVFTVVKIPCRSKLEGFVTVRNYHPSLQAINRLGCKWVFVTNTVAYRGTKVFITKKIIVAASGPIL
jgi:hypothetical protein